MDESSQAKDSKFFLNPFPLPFHPNFDEEISMTLLNFIFGLLLVAPAAISGTVGAIGPDSAPFMMPGTTVTLTTTQGHVLFSTVTDERGEFSFMEVEPGNYRL